MMMKSNFKILVGSLLLLLGLGTATTAFAQEPVRVKIDGINYDIYNQYGYTYDNYYEDSELFAAVAPSDAYDYAGDVTIPSSVVYNGQRYYVRQIGSSAFKNCAEMTSVSLPANIRKIEDYAFAKCSALKQITIPDSVYYMNSYVFEDCSALETVSLSDRITCLSYSLFSGCSSLKSLKSPRQLTTIDNSCFQGCRSLESITIPSTVTCIYHDAFGGCYSLKSLYIEDVAAFCNINTYTSGYSQPLFQTALDLYLNNQKVVDLEIPAGVTAIQPQIFSSIKSIESVKIPSGVKIIEQYAFNNCPNLKKVYLPSSIKRLEIGVFESCSNLKELHIEDLSAFCSINAASNPLGYGCDLYLKEALVTDLVIPENLTLVKNGIFNGCTSIKSVTLPKGTTEVGDQAFYNCPNLQTINFPQGFRKIGSSAFSYCSSLKNVTLPLGLEEIGPGAFYDSFIDSIYLPSTVKCIGYGAFKSEFHQVKSVHVDDLSAFLNIALSDTTSSPLRDSTKLYVKGQCIENLVIPEDIVDLRPYTFAHNKRLKSVTFHKGIKSVGEECFNCTRLISNSNWYDHPDTVHVASIERVNVEDIASFCNIEFADSSSNPLCHYASLYTKDTLVTNLVIPNEVQYIKPYAFWGADSINLITLSDSVKTIGKSAFGKVSASSLMIKAQNPPSVTEAITDGVIIVPAASLAKYCTAPTWSDWRLRIYPDNAAYTYAEVTAQDKLSDLHRVIGEPNLENIFNLKVKGTINSYDIILIRNKMLRLKELDLTEATLVNNDYPYYESYSTKDSLITPCMFYNLKLRKIALPKNTKEIGYNAFAENKVLQRIFIPDSVTNIGTHAFENCSALTEVTMGASVDTVDYCAFNNCYNLKKLNFSPVLKYISSNAFNGNFLEELRFPNSLRYIGDNAFSNNYNLKHIVFSKNLEYIGSWAFHNCGSLQTIKLPTSLKRIANCAFMDCSGLKEVRIPSSVRYVGQEAFKNCSNVQKVYTYTIEPTNIEQQTFSCWNTAELMVPKTSYYTYYYNTQWSQFSKLTEFDEPYENFYLQGDYTLDDNTGRVDGTPDVEIDQNAGFIIDGSEIQTTDSMSIKHDGENGGSIIADDNLHANKLSIRIHVHANRWYFFCFPFDIPAANVTCENTKDYVFRYYDGKIRALQGFGGWKDFTGDTFKMGNGYIFQCAKDDVLTISLKDVKFNRLDKIKDLVEHIAENLQNASWNLVGNPFLSYYDIKKMDYNAPITVWDGNNYVAYNPKDDDYQLAPFEAFFVQKPAHNPSLNFAGQSMLTYHQSQKVMAAAQAKRATMKTNPSRLLVNLTLHTGNTTDQTRIVFNDDCQMSYEMECDAAKFLSENSAAQLYSIDADQAHYAINERPNAEGAVALGFVAKHAGNYTLSASRMDVPMLLRDHLNQVTFDLRLGDYHFESAAGTFNNRFSLLKNNEPTGIEELLEKTGVEMTAENGQLNIANSNDAQITVYNVAGQQVAQQSGDGSIRLAKGNYIVKIGGLSVKVSMK